MKKSLFLLAAVAILASCQDNEIKNNVKEFNESAIAFETYAGIQTKGADNNKDASELWLLENHNTTFDVWAWKYYNGAWVSTPVYDKGVVTYNPNATATETYFKWDVTPEKFWDKSADKYYFYAASPSNAAWTLTGTGDQGKLSYANFTLAGGLANNLSYNTNGTVTTEVKSFKTVTDVDLMIAEDNLVPRAKYNKNQPDKVNEIFNHILSRLNVTVALKANGAIDKLNKDDDDTNDVIVKVTSFGITGVNLKNKGSFNEDAALGNDVLENGTIKRWPTVSVDGTYNLPGADISDIELDAEHSLYIAQYLIIPQAITSEVLDRAKATLPDTYFTEQEIAAAENDDQAAAHNKTIYDVKEAGAAASHPYLKIDYTIGTEPYTAYYNLANAFGIAEGETLNFCEGWQNTLNIKIDADIIVFDAEVYEWKDKANEDVTIFD